MLKKIALGGIIFLGIIILFLLSTIALVDYTPLNQLPEVSETMQRLDKMQIKSSEGNHALKVGWSSINITPKSPINMAGYGPRGPYVAVMDSLYARTIVFDNGETKLAIISLDLLMFPRVVMKQVYDTLQNYGFTKDQLFLSATHTHSGFGNWEKSRAGQFIFGAFDQDNVNYLTNKIVDGVKLAMQNASLAEVGFQKIDARDYVVNRVSGENGIVDPFLRLIQIKKENGNIGMIISYAAHAVNLDSDIWELSRDYPGIIVDKVEENPAVDFAMFCAGMVASHNVKSAIPKGPDRIMDAGENLSKKIIDNIDSATYSNKTLLGGIDIKIDLPPSQMRITCDFRIRDWFFSAFFDPLQANIKIMKIGDVLLLGMPCDFSGELSINNQLDKLAKTHGKDLFITSFNGNYIGYITEDGHYAACNHDEVKTMNWVGPDKGKYFTDIIKSAILATDRE